MESFMLGLLNLIWPWINLFLMLAIGGGIVVCVVLLIRRLRRKGK